MNQNTIATIQGGLMNYIGTALEALPEGGLKKNRAIVAMLMDSTLASAKPSTDKPHELGILEPVFKGIINVLTQHQKIAAAKGDKDRIILYQNIIDDLSELISLTKLEE